MRCEFIDVIDQVTGEVPHHSGELEDDDDLAAIDQLEPEIAQTIDNIVIDDHCDAYKISKESHGKEEGPYHEGVLDLHAKCNSYVSDIASPNHNIYIAKGGV